MKLETIIAENLLAILERVDLRPKNFSDLCLENDIPIDKSFISRVARDSANFRVDKLCDMVKGVNLINGFDWVTVNDMVTPGRFVPGAPKEKVKIDREQLNDCFMQMLVDMDEMEWLTINSNVELKTIAAYCIVQLKQCGIEAVNRTAEQAKFTLQA